MDLNENEEDAVHAHKTVINFTTKKRLEISWKKCAIISVNSKKVPKLMVDGKQIKTESTFKYLGDFINNKGTNSDLVEDRVKKGDGCAVTIVSIVQQITFGVYAMEATLLLYNSIFIASMIYNAQSWSNMTKTDINKLRGCQLSFLKRILHAPKSAPTAIVFGELGILPIEFEVYRRKLMFLQHILKLSPSDPVKQVYWEQKQFEFERNWANEVDAINKTMDINCDLAEIEEMTKYQWKGKVTKAIGAAALKEINTDSSKLKKVQTQYNMLKTKDYLVKLPISDARIAFAYRSGTFDIKSHRTYNYTDLKCRGCGEQNETIHHIVNECSGMERDCELNVKDDDFDTISETVKRLKTFTQKFNPRD